MLLLLLGCLSVDRDGDGIPEGADCDDGDAGVGLAARWYADGDGDGWGVYSSDPPVGCDAPEGHAPRSGDCDDADGDRFPDNPEICDEVDQDCDGLVDEDGEEPRDWYMDMDGDGYGVGGPALEQCQNPGSGYSAAGGDCDDEDDAALPGGEEFCDGADTDCDGRADPSGCLPIEDAGRLAGERDSENLGWAVAVGEGLAAASAPGDGAVGRIALVDPVSAAPLGVIDGTPGLPLGYSLAVLDLDRDGLADVAGGVPCAWWQACDGQSGVLVTLGAAAEDGPVGAVLLSGGEEAAVGRSLAAVDGEALLIGAPSEQWNDVGSGAVWLVQSSEGGPLDEVGLSITGSREASLGEVVAAGDLDGDGLDEVVVGDTGGDALHLFAGRPAGDLRLADADATVISSEWVTLGGSAAVVDLGGDGYGDLVAGAWYDDWVYQGALLVMPGPLSGEVVGEQTPDVLAHDILADTGDLALAGAPSSGEGALAVGDWSYDTNLAAVGVVFWVRGPVGGFEALDERAEIVHGVQIGQALGYAVAAGDADGDGLSELLVGSPGAGDAGAVFLFPGSLLF